MADWFYYGHFGRLGPLPDEQIEELIECGVVVHETYVWRDGLAQWTSAGSLPELRKCFSAADPIAMPPPPPSAPVAGFESASMPQMSPSPNPHPAQLSSYSQYGRPMHVVPISDRSRPLAGVLNLIFPGVGRLYLGYMALGILQLLFALCGVGIIWSFIDGILMLAGSLKYDGYGRRLKE